MFKTARISAKALLVATGAAAFVAFGTGTAGAEGLGGDSDLVEELGARAEHGTHQVGADLVGLHGNGGLGQTVPMSQGQTDLAPGLLPQTGEAGDLLSVETQDDDMIGLDGLPGLG